MIETGMFISDRYEIVGKVGAGGMSDVYKAKDHILGRFVAIKVLKQEFAEDRSFVSKFRTEAQSAAGLEHPNIVNIYDVGSDDNGYYIVMEYVEGITLKTYIEKKGQLSFKESASIAIQVARGIEAAHNKEIIHRDIKPQNIIISTEGKVKVTDFGIAKAATSNTISSDVMGSVHYVSPEQARNGFVDFRSDLYSLGIVMYEMVTGRVPFDGDTTVAVAIQHLQEEMTPPSKFAPNIPISFEKIILKCTQKNADRRYQSISELISDLRRSLTNPNEDFVVIPPLFDAGKTRAISQDELKIIKDQGESLDEETPEPEEKKKKSIFAFLSGNSKDEDVEEDDEEEDDDEEGGLFNPKMDRIVTIMGIATAIILVIFIIAVLGAFFDLWKFGGRKDTQSQATESQMTQATEIDNTVEMISIVGMSFEEAKAALEEKGLAINIIARLKSDKEEGTVLSQNKNVGDSLEKGTIVGVEVAGESEDISGVPVPNLIGMKENEAVNEISMNQLQYKKEYEYSDSVPAGIVISQEPQEGEVVAGTTITIIISQGEESAVVPNVLGKSQSFAQAEIENAGLRYAVITDYSDTVEAGFIIAQDLEPGKKVARGKTVTITVSQGKKIEYYKVSVTKTYEGAISCTYSLKGSNGTEYASGSADGDSVTVTASDMNCSSGTLTIVWTYTVASDTPDDGEDGQEPAETGKTATVSKTYDVSFEKQ